jgi:flagellar biosynthesis protein FlhF
MKMKRYFAADSRQALRALRDEQGVDAVILSNRRVSGGVEIIAAMDYEEAMENMALENADEKSNENNINKNMDADTSVIQEETTRQLEPVEKTKLPELKAPELKTPEFKVSELDVAKENVEKECEKKKISFETTSFEKSRELAKQEAENFSMLNKIQNELAGLRNIMEAPLMQFSWGEMDRVRPMYASLLKQLMSLGLSSKLSQSIAEKLASEGLTKQSWGESLNHLAKLVPVNNEDIISTGGIVSLVGPTGVGKTTTIAKLAAHFALKYGRKGVTLITTDNYRIGAHEQLRSYGRILGIPVHVASDAEELKTLLEDAKQKSGEHQLTLIDTAGVSQKDINLTEQITSLDIDGIDIKNYLVLSATGQMNLQDEVVDAFSILKLNGCVITKTDEAASLGEIISVVIQHDLPVSYICDGQKVPDDIHQAEGSALVEEAVTLMRDLNKSLSDEALAYTFGGVVNNASF